MLAVAKGEHDDSLSESSSSEEEGPAKLTDSEKVQKVVKTTTKYLKSYERVNVDIHKLEQETDSHELLHELDKFEILIRHRII